LLQLPDFAHEFPRDQSVSEFPLVSIIISNYNYERFIREAVDSALNQTYPKIEIVVVDDGSTDGSYEIIASYGEQVTPVKKDNGGQASACNVGFQVSTGEITIFLDADDVLLPDTVARVVAAFQLEPGVAKVQYRQRLIDANGKPLGGLQPRAALPMQSGDLRPRLMELAGYTYPTTSGNAFATAVLRRIMPIPEALYRGIPDQHLCNLSPVFGEVVSLENPGSLYRVHGGNNWFDPTASINLDGLRKVILAIDDSHMRKKYLFSTLYSVDTRRIGTRDPHLLIDRMISLKLDPQHHPFKETLWTLSVQGSILFLTLPDPALARSTRLFHVLWFAAMLLAPEFLAWPLAKVLKLEKRKWLHHKFAPLLKRV
jgi:hypothetical protein